MPHNSSTCYTSGHWLKHSTCRKLTQLRHQHFELSVSFVETQVQNVPRTSGLIDHSPTVQSIQHVFAEKVSKRNYCTEGIRFSRLYSRWHCLRLYSIVRFLFMQHEFSSESTPCMIATHSQLIPNFI